MAEAQQIDEGRRLSGLLTGADEIVDALRRRKDERGLSNEMVEEIAGLTAGAINKYLGPSREKTPTLGTLVLILGALGVGVVIFEDPDAVRRLSHRWTRRDADRVRDNGRIAKTAIDRARRVVIAEMARKAAAARWAKATPAERREHSQLMHVGKALKVLTGKQSA